MSYLAQALVVAALVTYTLRAVPLLLLRREIESRWINSFLYFVPWAVVSAMVIPDIFTSTSSVVSATIGLIVALFLAWRGRSLLVVVLAAAVAVYLTELVQPYLGF
jgi:branched-chain amino acid transporter